MTGNDTDPSSSPRDAIPVAELHPRERLSIVWLVPLVALAIGGWLLYQSLISADSLIHVRFDSGDGLKEGKTELRYQGVVIGQLKELHLAADGDGVQAQLAVKHSAANLLRQGSRFWLVKPQISLQGVSGLDTLVSGVYISFDPGPDEAPLEEAFSALASPPPDAQGEHSLVVQLHTDTLGSIQEGSPIHYRDIAVGRVQRYELNPATDRITIYAGINEPYRDLIRDNTRFWNNSGIRLEGGLSGLKLQTRSLAAMLMGGISFDLPEGEKPGQTVQSNQLFHLYPDFETANTGITISVVFERADGLEAGVTAVQYRGLKVGTVSKVRFGDNLNEVIADIRLPREAIEVLNENSRFWLVQPQLSLSGVSGLETLVRGNYIELDPGKGSKPQFMFKASAEPPVFEQNLPGKRLRLVSDDLADLSRGAPVYYRRIPVGIVQGHQLAPKGDKVFIDIQIEKKYARLVGPDSRFWKLSALNLKGGVGGLDLDLAPLRTLLAGGIEFDNLGGSDNNAKLDADHQFTLYSDRDSALRRGYKVELSFIDAPGIKPGSEIRHRGMRIGEVRSLRLDQRSNRILVTCLIEPGLASKITSGSHFWVVGPQFGLTGSQNLETLVSGSFIAFHPGSGKRARQVIGAEKAPNLIQDSNGLHLILEADRLGSITRGAPVYYRQITVGRVRGYELAPKADRVLIHISIEPRFAPLVHRQTRFWNNSGIDFSFKLLSGAKLQTESLETLLAGGISFATPEDPQQRGEVATAGTWFKLHDQADSSWNEWRPQIPLAH